MNRDDRVARKRSGKSDLVYLSSFSKFETSLYKSNSNEWGARSFYSLRKIKSVWSISPASLLYSKQSYSQWTKSNQSVCSLFLLEVAFFCYWCLCLLCYSLEWKVESEMKEDPRKGRGTPQFLTIMSPSTRVHLHPLTGGIGKNW